MKKIYNKTKKLLIFFECFDKLSWHQYQIVTKRGGTESHYT